MRVLYVIDSLINAGAETSLVHMAPGYRDLGMDLHVAFLKSRWHVAADLEAAGATLHPVALDQSRPRQLAALVRLIRQLNPDIVHTTLYEADVLGRTAARITRVPVVTTLANSSYSPRHFEQPGVSPLKLRLAQAVDVTTARFAAGFHAVSGAVASDMSPRLRLDPNKVVVIPRARRRDLLGEPSDERRHRVREMLRVGDDQQLVVAVARHEYQKGLDVLVEATALLRERQPGLAVVVAGREGRATEALTAAIRHRGLDDVVRLLGARNDVADIIVAGDVVAVPSRWEGLPGAVLEAMALERPVVASDIPMVREAIGEHAYALVPVDDPSALSCQLGRCLADIGRAETARAARRAFAARYTPDAVAAQLRGVYREVAALA